MCALKLDLAHGDAPGEAPMSVWAVSDGAAGMERQVQSVAYALQSINPGVAIRTVRLTPEGAATLLPPALWPDPKALLSADQRAILEERAPPDIWIGCGRRIAPYSMGMRRWSCGRTFVVQTQAPRGAPLSAFDLVAPPTHDRLDGPNVFSILGSPVFFREEALDCARADFPDLAHTPAPRVAVVIGGPVKDGGLLPGAADRLMRALERLTLAGATLWITASRRTPNTLRERLRGFALAQGFPMWAPGDEGANPYFAYLQACDAVLVSDESTNLICDAAWFARPIHLFALAHAPAKMETLHTGFRVRNAVRRFNGTIDVWDYPPVREAERLAHQILLRRDERLRRAKP